VETKLANLVASIEAGIDPTIIAPQVAARTTERNELQSRLRTHEREAGVGPADPGRDQFRQWNRPDADQGDPGELLDI
jgi:hypothetical protein